MDELSNLKESNAKLQSEIKALKMQVAEFKEIADTYKGQAENLELRLDNMRNDYHELKGENTAFRFCIENLKR